MNLEDMLSLGQDKTNEKTPESFERWMQSGWKIQCSQLLWIDQDEHMNGVMRVRKGFKYSVKVAHFSEAKPPPIKGEVQMA